MIYKKVTSSSPLILRLMAVEAEKAGSWKEYEYDFRNQVKRGIYYHITYNPDFKIDPNLGPRDMSSMADGSMSPGDFMFTSDLKYWLSEYKSEEDPKYTRNYVAILDLSAAPRDSYRQVKRGMGNEFYIENASNYVRVIKTVTREQARAFESRQDFYLPQSELELYQFYSVNTGKTDIDMENKLRRKVMGIPASKLRNFLLGE